MQTDARSEVGVVTFLASVQTMWSSHEDAIFLFFFCDYQYYETNADMDANPGSVYHSDVNNNVLFPFEYIVYSSLSFRQRRFLICTLFGFSSLSFGSFTIAVRFPNFQEGSATRSLMIRPPRIIVRGSSVHCPLHDAKVW